MVNATFSQLLQSWRVIQEVQYSWLAISRVKNLWLASQMGLFWWRHLP